jgi:hypothetical protein
MLVTAATFSNTVTVTLTLRKTAIEMVMDVEAVRREAALTGRVPADFLHSAVLLFLAYTMPYTGGLRTLFSEEKEEIRKKRQKVEKNMISLNFF